MIQRLKKSRPFIIFSLALTAIYWQSTQFPFWYDEHAFYRFGWEYSFIPNKKLSDMIEYSRQAFHPPLHFIINIYIAKFLNAINLYHFEVLRFISGVLSALSITLICESNRQKKRLFIYPLITSFLAFSCVIYYFQIGPYPFAFLFSTVYCLEIRKEILYPTQKFNILLFVSTIALSYTHYFGTLLVFVLGTISIFTAYILEKPSFAKLLKIHIASFLIFLPWLILVQSRLFESQDSYLIPIEISSPGLAKFQMYTSFLNHRVQHIIVFISLIIFSFVSKKRSPGSLTKLWLVTLASCIILLEIKSAISTPLLRSQYMMIFYPIFILLFSDIMESSFKTRRAGILFFFYFSIPLIFSNIEENKIEKHGDRSGQYYAAIETIIKDRRQNDLEPKIFHNGNNDIEIMPYGIKQSVKLDKTRDPDCNPNLSGSEKNNYLIIMFPECEIEKYLSNLKYWQALPNENNIFIFKKVTD